MKNGFIFGYLNTLGKSEMVTEKEMRKAGSGKCNHDEIPLYVRCEHCGTYMDFQPGPAGEFDGVWICPGCSTAVDELEAYVELNKENQEFLRRNELE